MTNKIAFFPLSDNTSLSFCFDFGWEGADTCQVFIRVQEIYQSFCNCDEETIEPRRTWGGGRRKWERKRENVKELSSK